MFPIRIVKNSLHDPFIFIKKMKPTAPAPYDPLFEAFMFKAFNPLSVRNVLLHEGFDGFIIIYLYNQC